MATHRVRAEPPSQQLARALAGAGADVRAAEEEVVDGRDVRAERGAVGVRAAACSAGGARRRAARAN